MRRRPRAGGAALGNTNCTMPGNHRSAPHPLDHGIVEQHLQIAAMNRKLGPVVAGEHAARLTPDDLAALGGIDQLLGADASSVEPGLQAQFGQFAH